ncbi:MAG: DUF2461 domain-containing protein [Oscillospiraceae bacterium]|jgi:uncharacterized protein (TIGR02453 family)|nr:DUF2461 domain-containing protein [Oscillospiraceae bacterium]
MPFEGFTQSTLDFMWELRFNNNKLWFEEHRAAYQRDLQAPMKALANDVFARIAEGFGGRGFRCRVSRINKDARRNHGDGPYRDHLWFSIERPEEEWTTAPVFWFELSPDGWSYGMGYYLARPETMAKLRARIDKNPKAFERFIAPLAKREEFVLDGDEYKRKKQAPTPKTAPWYNKKTFSLIHEGQHGPEIFSSALSDRIAGGFAFLMPFYDYFVTLNADPTPGT